MRDIPTHYPHKDSPSSPWLEGQGPLGSKGEINLYLCFARRGGALREQEPPLSISLNEQASRCLFLIMLQ